MGEPDGPTPWAAVLAFALFWAAITAPVWVAVGIVVAKLIGP